MQSKTPSIYARVLRPLHFLPLISLMAFGANAQDEPSPKVATVAANVLMESSSRWLSSADVLLLVLGAALIFFMQAGFALVEAGAARAKNSVNVLMKNYLDMCFGGIAFWLVGYSIMFGTNSTGWVGVGQSLFDSKLGGDHLFFLFQVMFCSTAATIVSGAAAERMKLSAYIVGSIVISAIIYPVFGSWAWGGWHGGSGWLAAKGYIDFAGSSVVHMVGGACALSAIMVLKPRLGRFTRDGVARDIPGHNLGMVALGTFILWMGWFGFNGSSIAITAGGTDFSLGRILVNTHLSGMAGAIGVMIVIYLSGHKVRLGSVANAGLSGLVAITAGCQVMSPVWALVTGLVGGILFWLATIALEKMRIDDVVGAVPVHLVNGIWGTLAAGLFNQDKFMDGSQILVQLTGIGAGLAWAFGVSFIMYFVLNQAFGIRASSIDEQRGLDYTEHDELAYPEFQEGLHRKS